MVADAQAPTTYPYKHVGGLAIEADVYRETRRHAGSAVVWIHGGALINGNRAYVPTWLREACADHGLALVSVDYRLAPETKLAEIVEDVVDAVRWLRAEGPRLDVDPDRIAVVGESAGGYLTLTAGFRVDPHPAALVSLYGYGGLIGDWYTQPSPHPCHHELRLSEREADRLAAGPPIADDRQRDGNGTAFYQFCRQHGSWPRAVSGWDPERDAARFEALMPVANVTEDYPPTLLIHGDLDTDVPFDESARMADQLTRHGVEHRLLRIAGAEHGFAGAEPPTIDAAMAEATAFLCRHLLEDDYGREQR
jgi:acetyl esterase/lipase